MSNMYCYSSSNSYRFEENKKMKSIYNFVITPKGDRYNNIKKFDDGELIVNTEVFNHHYVNREAIVVSTPIVGDTDIKPGDTVIIHHNVFRRWHNQYDIEKNSRSFFNENTYIVTPDQIFLYKRDGSWKAPSGYCFAQPLENDDIFSLENEKSLVGIVKYSDGTVDENDLIGFKPSSEYEFVIDGERLYRILSNLITIKYEYQGNEKAYNPSWAQSG